jgi:hypothetical protein
MILKEILIQLKNRAAGWWLIPVMPTFCGQHCEQRSYLHTKPLIYKDIFSLRKNNAAKMGMRGLWNSSHLMWTRL